MTSPERQALPSRWIRTLPWLAGLLIGASAHIVWWTSTRAPAEPVVRVVTVPSAPVHVVVHEGDGLAPEARQHAEGSCRRERERAAQRVRPRSGASGAMVCNDRGCKIRRSFLTEVLREPSWLGLQARMHATGNATGPAGLRIDEVQPGSVSDLLGLRSGDAILSIGGVPVGTGNTVELARTLDRLGALTIVVERDGRRHVLRHRVVAG